MVKKRGLQLGNLNYQIASPNANDRDAIFMRNFFLVALARRFYVKVDSLLLLRKICHFRQKSKREFL